MQAQVVLREAPQALRLQHGVPRGCLCEAQQRLHGSVCAIEAGSDGLLLDEDTSATNFMLRDGRMQKLVRAENEPITPFVDRVREIFNDFGVSSILVMGGSGDYFDVADTVIMMKDYQASDATQEARKIALEMSNGRRSESRCPLEPFASRRSRDRSRDRERPI